MATGYSTQVIAEGRQRLKDVLEGIDDIYVLMKRIQEAGNFYQDTATLYRAGYQAILALVKDFEIFKKYIETNRESLHDKEYEYYSTRCNDIHLQIEALSTAIVSPSISDPFPVGTENDTDVGANFAAVVTSVPDGDTLVVRGRKSDSDEAEKVLTVRIAGIDAAESGTDRGDYARVESEKRWLNKEVLVFYDRHTPNDQYGRVLGTVYDGDTNFAIWSLTNCLSEPNTKFGKNHYVDPVEIKQAADKCLLGWPPYGIVKVISSPTHASVYVGQVGSEDLKLAEGITPCELKLPVGKYVVLISAPECSSIRDEIEVKPVKQQLPIYNLQKYPAKLGTIAISVPPIGVYSIVSVNGAVIGLAPVTIDLPTDVPSEISVTTEDGRSVEEIVYPEIGKFKRVAIIP